MSEIMQDFTLLHMVIEELDTKNGRRAGTSRVMVSTLLMAPAVFLKDGEPMDTTTPSFTRQGEKISRLNRKILDFNARHGYVQEDCPMIESVGRRSSTRHGLTRWSIQGSWWREQEMKDRLHISDAHKVTVLNKIMRSARKLTAKRNLIELPLVKKKRLSTTKLGPEKRPESHKKSPRNPDSHSGSKQHHKKDLRDSLNAYRKISAKEADSAMDPQSRKLVRKDNYAYRRSSSPFWGKQNNEYVSRRERSRLERPRSGRSSEDERRRSRLRGIASVVTRASPPVTRYSFGRYWSPNKLDRKDGKGMEEKKHHKDSREKRGQSPGKSTNYREEKSRTDRKKREEAREKQKEFYKVVRATLERTKKKLAEKEKETKKK